MEHPRYEALEVLPSVGLTSRLPPGRRVVLAVSSALLLAGAVVFAAPRWLQKHQASSPLADLGDGAQSLQNKAASGNAKCPSEWTDSMHFDCQLYEGARWCDSSTRDSEGYGWCEESEKCDDTPVQRGGYALTGSQKWGWGDF